MYRNPLLYLWLLLTCCSPAAAQQCRLHTVYHQETDRISLDWNMIPYSTKTIYVLLRSTDQRAWSVVAADPVLRNYTEEDVFDYDEKVNSGGIYYYRLKILDAGNNTVALSNIAGVNTTAGKDVWVVYPNPVYDVLHLAYKGNNPVKGVINVLIADASGKTVIRFRSASIYKSLQIPVSNLRNGIYLVQIIVMNEVMLNQQFIKQ